MFASWQTGGCGAKLERKSWLFDRVFVLGYGATSKSVTSLDQVDLKCRELLQYKTDPQLEISRRSEIWRRESHVAVQCLARVWTLFPRSHKHKPEARALLTR